MSLSKNTTKKSNHLNRIITIEKTIKNNLLKKYGSKNPSSLKYQYIGLVMENLIFNKNTHQVTLFKDYMISDYYDEFFKRFYLRKESTQRVPKFSHFYKNYLKFFCIPTLIDIYSNEIIHSCSEKKAELFYNENYKRKKKDNSELKDVGLYQDSESEMSESKSDNNLSKKIFFNETARKKIERISPINTSIVLNESETKLKEDESGLLITASEIDSMNDNSLRDIMIQMKKNKKNNNNQKLTLYASDYTSYKIMNKIKDKNSRNKSLDIVLNNNNNNINNKNKQLTAYNVPKEAKNKNNFKNSEQIKTNNYLLNVNNSNQINKKNNSKIITSINNINNNNYNKSRNLSQNPQVSSSINNNTYSRNNNLEKINNIKRTINLNIIKSKNIPNFLGNLPKHNTINTNQQSERRPKNVSNKTVNNKESITNSAKSIFIKNNELNNNMRMTSYKYFIKNASSSHVKLPKANNNNINKKTARILSYKDFQKSENENIKKNRNNKNMINTKLSFDGILHNNNNNKRYNIINYNGDKHIHNINININNHINIGPKQFQDIFTFSDLVKMQKNNINNNPNKKNSIYAFLKTSNKNNNYISRNKNQSLDYNSIINTNNNKISSVTDIHNSLNKKNIYKTQYLISKGKSGNMYNLKNKKSNRIKLNNDNIFKTIKSKI